MTMRDRDSENKYSARSRPSRALILLVVFCSGYIVMALEILAFRIIQAGIDSSIIATGAILGVILSALTIGYWLGGTWSARFNPTGIQAFALIVAGIWIFSLAGMPDSPSDLVSLNRAIVSGQGVAPPPPWKSVPDYIVNHPISENMEIRLRLDPLLASLYLFAVPSFLLAMVGPCAVQILTRKTSDAGRTAGWVFALGSLGSIVGVIVTSFWLIAYAGITANLRIIGLAALLTGIIVSLIRNPHVKTYES